MTIYITPEALELITRVVFFMLGAGFQAIMLNTIFKQK